MTDPRNGPERPAPPPGVDAERLAALLDGRLDEGERAEVLARLAASDEDFGAFVDALEVTRELEAEDAGAGDSGAGGVTPLRPRAERRWWGRPGGHWLALAAGLAGVVLLPVLWMQTRGPDRDDPGRFAALLRDRGAGLPAEWDRSPWGTTRGPGDPLTPEARAVRLGARLTELEVAVAAGDPAAAEISGQVVALLDGVPGAAAAAEIYRRVGERAGDSPGDLLPLLKAGWKAVGGLMEDEELFELGAWAQAGRIAAARRDAGFFESRTTRAALDGVLPLPALEEPARAAVERIQSSLREDTLDWSALQLDLTELLRVAGS